MSTDKIDVDAIKAHCEYRKEHSDTARMCLAVLEVVSSQQARIGELEKDKARLDWREANPTICLDYQATQYGVGEKLKEQFPNGYWRQRFGWKDSRNRFKTYREAIDAVRPPSPESEKGVRG